MIPLDTPKESAAKAKAEMASLAEGLTSMARSLANTWSPRTERSNIDAATICDLVRTAAIALEASK